MKIPATRYARNGDVRIAYQVAGQGALDLVFVPGFISNLEIQWEDPGYLHLLRRLSAFSRLILFDKRGTGLSDRIDPARLPDLQTRIEDLRAVLDATGSTRAALLGASEGAPMALMFAASFPERVRSLVIYGGYAHFHGAVSDPNAVERFVREVETNWGSGTTLRHFAPGRVDDPHFSAWWARFERLSASPSAAVALARMNALIDIRPLLSEISAPTLVIHRTDDARVKVDAGRYLAEYVPGARLVELPGRDHPVWTGDVDRVVDTMEEFLTGERRKPDGLAVLGAIYCARILGAANAGDPQRHERIERFVVAADEATRRHGGATWHADGERFLARFASVTRAARCATELREEAARAEIRVAHGLHVGETEDGLAPQSGSAALIAQQVAQAAAAGEILASEIVSQLALGTGVLFAGRPPAKMDGRPQPLRLVTLISEQHLEPAARDARRRELDILSTREREVLALVARGLSNRRIAGRLGLSEHTVKRHVANILMKLDLPTRTAAAGLALGLPM